MEQIKLDKTRVEHKRSTFKIDGETESRLEYLKKVYAECLPVYGNVSQSVIMKRAIEFYSEFMPQFLRTLSEYHLKEKAAIKRLRKHNHSPVLKIDSIIDPDTGRLATYSTVVQMEADRINEQLREMNGNREVIQ